VASSFLVETVIILILILVNGLLAMSEIAIVSARKTRLQQMAENGNVGARKALDLAAEPSSFLASVQIGITLVGILAGVFGGATIADGLAVKLAEVPGLAPYAHALAVGLVVVVVTTLTLIFGELVPKRLALSGAERIAAMVAGPVRFISVVAMPFVSVLSFTTEKVLRTMGVKPRTESPVTEEEVQILIEQGTRAGVFEKTEETMMKRVLRLGDLRTGDLMTPRTLIVALDLEDSYNENLGRILAEPHSFFPIYRGNSDHFVGLVSLKALLARMATGQPVVLADLMTDPLFVAETTAAPNVLEQFKKTGKPIALVVDEYGITAGLVTLTDVLEAIVGDISLEETQGDQSIVKRADGSWLMDGMLSVHEFMEALRLKVPDEEEPHGAYQTLGGFVMAKLSRIPATGDAFEWWGYRFEVVDMDGHRVDKVLVTPLCPVLVPGQENGGETK